MTIKTTLKLLSLLLSTALFVSLTACGSGGGGSTTPTPVPQLLTVTLSLDGSAATTVGAVDLAVTLPDGFVLETDGAGQPTASALTFLVEGATAVANYTPALTANGEVVVAIVKDAGFPGNSSLLQLSCFYPAGATLPAAGDFMVSLTATSFDSTTNSTIELPYIAETVTVTQQDAP